jgi:hypothetical protein
MDQKDKYIIVKGGKGIPLSQIVADCDVNSCVKIKKGESLIKVLQDFCSSKKGDKGDQGPQGNKGDTGPQGF